MLRCQYIAIFQLLTLVIPRIVNHMSPCWHMIIHYSLVVALKLLFSAYVYIIPLSLQAYIDQHTLISAIIWPLWHWFPLFQMYRSLHAFHIAWQKVPIMISMWMPTVVINFYWHIFQYNINGTQLQQMSIACNYYEFLLLKYHYMHAIISSVST